MVDVNGILFESTVLHYHALKLATVIDAAAVGSEDHEFLLFTDYLRLLEGIIARVDR